MNFYAFPAWSLSGTHYNMKGEVDLDASPGPVYDVSDSASHGPTWKFGSSKRSSMGTTDTPLPGHYKITESPSAKHKYTIPKDSRQESPNNNPGPGAHSPKFDTIKDKINAYSMAYKYDSGLEDKRKLPGPGEYEVNIKPNIVTKNSRFGTSSRKSLGGDPRVPGPGQYEVRPKTSLKGSTIGNSKRQTKAFENPGPGTYQIPSQVYTNALRKKGYSLSNKLLFKPYENKIISPGPCTYNMDLKLDNKAPSYTIGKSPRKKQDTEVRPGPQDYKIKESLHIYNGNIGASTRYNDKDEQFPGPGTYQASDKKAVSFTVPRSKSMLNTRSTDYPGPGQYNIQKGMAFEKSRGSTIGNSRRTNFVSKNKVGPGQYNINTQIPTASKGITIPKDGRHLIVNKNPGPGHYIVQSTVSNLSKYALYRRQDIA